MMNNQRYQTLGGIRHALPVLLALLLVGFASAGKAAVKTDSVKPDDVQSGTYKVITYERDFQTDRIPVALLQQEGAPGSIKFTTPGPVTVAARGLPADQAVRLGQKFVESNPTVAGTSMAKIISSDGTVIGYEIKPVFMAPRYGSSPVVGTDFSVEPNQTLAAVRVDPLLREMEQGGG